VNLSRYVGNGATNATDPSGLQKKRRRLFPREESIDIDGTPLGDFPVDRHPEEATMSISIDEAGLGLYPKSRSSDDITVRRGELSEIVPVEAFRYARDAVGLTFFGDCSGADVNLLGIAGSIALGAMGWDTHKDVADIIYGIEHWDWTWGSAGNMAVNVIAVFPGIGIIKNLADVKGLKNVDELSEAGKGAKLRKVEDCASKGLARGITDLAEGNITNSGKTVLGHFPGYIDKAKARGASYFDIGDAWDSLTPAQRWAANTHFLDKIAANGDQVLLSLPKTKIRPGSYLADEIQYLIKEKGYRWINQWSLGKP